MEEHVTVLPEEDAAIVTELEATRREIEMLRGNLRGELEQLPIGGAEMPRHGLAPDDETSRKSAPLGTMPAAASPQAEFKMAVPPAPSATATT